MIFAHWNRFGAMCTGPILIWSTAALITAALRMWPLAETLGIATWSIAVAQYQWGRS